MRALRKLWSLVLLTLLTAVPSTGSAEFVKKKLTAKKGSALYAVTSTLKLIADDKHDEWMEKWCDKKSSCSGRATRARIMIKIAKKKITKGCVKSDKVYVKQQNVKKKDSNGEPTKWMYIVECKKGKTITFMVQKRGKDWKVRGMS